MGHDRLPEQKVALAKERSERATSRIMKRKLEQLPTKGRKRMLPLLPIVDWHNIASDLNEHIQKLPTNSTVKASSHTETTTNSETLTQNDRKLHGKSSNKEPIQQESTSCQTTQGQLSRVSWHSLKPIYWLGLIGMWQIYVRAW